MLRRWIILIFVGWLPTFHHFVAELPHSSGVGRSARWGSRPLLARPRVLLTGFPRPEPNTVRDLSSWLAYPCSWAQRAA